MIGTNTKVFIPPPGLMVGLLIAVMVFAMLVMSTVLVFGTLPVGDLPPEAPPSPHLGYDPAPTGGDYLAPASTNEGYDPENPEYGLIVVV